MRDLFFESQRKHALTFPCDYCDTEIGQRCFDPHTGIELARQPAHFMRLNAGPVPEETR